MAFSEEMVQAVWEKGAVVLGHSSDWWRKDACGAWIGRDFYGNRESGYGWEIDPIDSSDSEDLSNLRPLQWLNHADKTDGRLQCNVVADGIDNKDKNNRI